MKRFFGSDTRLFMIMTMLMELAEINLLFIACSLPVVTMGAACSAMYGSLYQMQKYDGGAFSVKQFWNQYKRSLKTTVPIWCVGLAAMALLVGNLMMWFGSMQGIMRLFLWGIYLIFLILINGMLQILFFSLSMTQQWSKDMIKDAFLLAVAKFPFMILMGLVTASPLVILTMTGAALLRMLPVILLFWIACPEYVCVLIMAKILKPVYPEWFSES